MLGPAPGTPEFMKMLGEFKSATAAMADAGVLRYAAMIPSARYGSVEVRPVMVMGAH